ncbi:HYR domain-containing protein, partial [Subsaxibacter sp. CAU 1640]|uniref:HYR domain-containing protein n=1 Tax=Subsaxibacter sp. CAU 1640 TaxID=2933271 RepID=UPI002004DEB8
MKQNYNNLLIQSAFILLFAIQLQAQSGIYESYAILNINGNGNVYYDLQANTANADFEGSNLGSFDCTGSLLLNGAQNKIYKCGSDDIINGYFQYRIYLTTDTPPSFSSSSEIFYTTDDGSSTICTPGINQIWETNAAGINVLNGLSAGTYYLEVFTQADFTYSVGSGTHYANNSANNYKATFSIIADTTNPVISGCPANISVTNDAGNCSATVTWTPPTAADNCSQTLTSSHSPGDTFALGTTTVTYTSTDAAGNIDTCSFDITVSDNENPVISGCPANISVANDAGNCSAAVSWTPPTASDNCSQTLTSSYSPGDTFALGTTTVTYTSTDAAGNLDTCSFDITVSDNENPVISGCPANITVANDAGNCSAAVSWTAPTASDNCSQTLTSSHSPGDTFALGTTTVTYTSTDAAGNIDTCSF